MLVATNSNFLPIIVQSLGYSTVKTNLYVVAPACVAGVMLIVFCFMSDHFQERGLHMVGVLVLSVVGYIILMTVDVHNQGVRYFAVFVTTIGVSPEPLWTSWM